MSPLPDRLSQYPHFALPKPIPSDEQLSAASDSTRGVPPSDSSDAVSESASANGDNETSSSVPKRPLMRPVNRPQPPSQSPAQPLAAKPAATPARVQSAVPSSEAEKSATAESDSLSEAQAAMRQQPISPPSEPKQYRAIGLLRGQYTPSEEQFTRGELKTTDGTLIEAVLLGRVMSLVRNHLNLEEDHLWVVYPRTRDEQESLHAQIVGVWEPEKLSKDAEEEESSFSDESAEEEQAKAAEEDISPGYQDNYFSIRGEVVFYSAEDKQVVVKIQQAARKSSGKSKAFKLKLEGVLDTTKILGYFWDFNVERRDSLLVITDSTVIGMVPPRKKPKSEFRKDRRSFRKPMDQRPGGHRGSGGSTPVRREPLPKPVKRGDPANNES